MIGVTAANNPRDIRAGQALIKSRRPVDADCACRPYGAVAATDPAVRLTRAAHRHVSANRGPAFETSARPRQHPRMIGIEPCKFGGLEHCRIDQPAVERRQRQRLEPQEWLARARQFRLRTSSRFSSRMP